MKITKKYVEAVFERFLGNIGGRKASSYNDTGAFQLDYKPIFGYRIEKIDNSLGGISTPFGDRKKPLEFTESLHVAMDAIRYLKKQK